MKIKFKVGIASEEWAYAPGQVAEVEDELAKKWIAGGEIAESAEPEKSEAPKVVVTPKAK